MNIVKNSRLYKFLRKIAGDDISITPASILEDCLDDIADTMADNALPSVSSVDNGKILKVTEGAWAKGDAPTELPEVTGSDNGLALVVKNGAWDKGGPVQTIDMNEFTNISYFMQILLESFTASAVSTGGFTYVDNSSTDSDVIAEAEVLKNRLTRCYANDLPIMIYTLNYSMVPYNYANTGLAWRIGGKFSGFYFSVDAGIIITVVGDTVTKVEGFYSGFAKAAS